MTTIMEIREGLLFLVATAPSRVVLVWDAGSCIYGRLLIRGNAQLEKERREDV
jgi:hypothetical protein